MMRTKAKLWLCALLAAAMACSLALAALLWPSAAAEAAAMIGGVRVKGNGNGTQTPNASLIYNLPESHSLAGAESIVFEMEFKDDDDAVVPFVVDSAGNYYEFMGTGGVSGSYRRAKTYSMLEGTAPTSVGGWANIRAQDLSGVFCLSVPLSSFYMRASLNNIGSGSLETAAAKGAALTADAALVAAGVRVPENDTSHADFVLGRIWAQGEEDVLICDPAALTPSQTANYGYNKSPGIWWVAYVGSFGSFDTDGTCKGQGWFTDFVSLEGGLPADYAAVSAPREESGYFDGLNYRMTKTEAEAAYQSIVLPAYAGTMKGAVLAFPFYDRGGTGMTWELRLSDAENKEYGTSGAQLYYVTTEYALQSTVKSNWSIVPPAGFCGYVLVDLSTVTDSGFSALTEETAQGLHLRLGMHGAWNGDTLVNYDIGEVKAYHKPVTAETDFDAWLAEGGETVFDFADDAAADGLREGMTMSWISKYNTVLRRVRHTYDYKSETEPRYGRLDGVNLALTDAADDTYMYLEARGRSSDLSAADHFAVRVADHANNAGNFEFYFYDADKTFATRSGLLQDRDAYLFDSSGAFVQSIRAYNAWSWITLPARFDGWLVVPTDSIDWQFDRTDAAYAVFITNGPEGIRAGTGSDEDPASEGLSFDFGQMVAFAGAFNEDKSNFSALLGGGTVYAELLASDRRSISAQVSGTGLTEGVVTPVVGYDMPYSYMDVEGIVLEAGGQGGSAAAAVPAGKRPALYVYNEAFAPLSVTLSYVQDGAVQPVEGATLVSALDDVSEVSATEGAIQLPDSYEGWVVLPAGEGSLQIELAADARLGLRWLFALNEGVSFADAGEVFAKSVVVLRTVTATDEELAEALALSGMTVQRAVNSYYMTDDAPTTIDDEAAPAVLTLPQESGNRIYAIKNGMPAFKSEQMYEGTPTFDYAAMPQLLKGGMKYILFEEGGTVTATAAEGGAVYVFAGKDFAADGFVKFMAIDSFIDGIEGRIYGYRRTLGAGDPIEVQGAYLIAADGQVSEPLASSVPAEVLFGEDFPTEYLHENSSFWSIPGLENVGGRLYMAMLTGGTTEPVIDNVAVLYTSEDGGGTWQPYAVIDHPYETAARVLDTQVWYADGKLWVFWGQADASFGGIMTWAMYSENAGAENLEDVAWSEPIRLFGGLMNSKPIKLSDGSYLYNANFPENEPGTVHVYKSTDGGMTAPEIGLAYSSQGTGVTFTEAKIVELNNGALWMVRRLESTSSAEENFSLDGGVNWTSATLNEALQTGSSRFVLTRLPSGNLLYVGNFGASRSKLTALLSEDEGKTWPYSLELDAREWTSYPDFTYTEDGDIMVAYDKGRTSHLEIRYAVFNESDIKAGAFTSENAVKMAIAFKSDRYKEIASVAGADGWKTQFPAGTTRAQVLAQFPESLTVTDNLGAESTLTGVWTMGRVDANGDAVVTFTPDGGLPSSLEDSYGLLRVVVNIAPRVVQGIEVTAPTKTEYAVGERLNTAGAQVKVTYNDGTTGTVPIGECEIAGFDSSTAGEKTVTVTYGGHSASFTVTVKAAGGSSEGPAPDGSGTETPAPDGPGTGSDPAPDEGCGGCGGTAAGVSLGLGALFAGAALVVLCKKRRA